MLALVEGLRNERAIVGFAGLVAVGIGVFYLVAARRGRPWSWRKGKKAERENQAG